MDVAHVAQIAIRAALQSNSQNCVVAERFYVHQDVYDSFKVQVINIVKSVRVGFLLEEMYDMGAVCL